MPEFVPADGPWVPPELLPAVGPVVPPGVVPVPVVVDGFDWLFVDGFVWLVP